jgi:hypothetical protein
MKDVDCTVSPYVLQEYLSDANNLASIADGHRLRIGFTVKSRPDEELCDAGKGDDIGLMRLGPNSATGFKAILDSRSFRSVDLGGHFGAYFPPHDTRPEKYTLLSIIHVHSRCLEHKIANTRKAVTSHQIISENWSDETVLTKLKEYVGSDVCNVTSSKQMKKTGDSSHKVLFLAHALAKCPSTTPDGFYPILGENEKVNMDFQEFLLKAEAKYNSLQPPLLIPRVKALKG